MMTLRRYENTKRNIENRKESIYIYIYIYEDEISTDEFTEVFWGALCNYLNHWRTVQLGCAYISMFTKLQRVQHLLKSMRTNYTSSSPQIKSPKSQFFSYLLMGPYAPVRIFYLTSSTYRITQNSLYVK